MRPPRRDVHPAMPESMRIAAHRAAEAQPGAQAARAPDGHAPRPALAERQSAVPLWRRVVALGVLWLLGLTPLVHAQATTGQGSRLCPPIDPFLSPTLLDFLIFPGITFR